MLSFFIYLYIFTDCMVPSVSSDKVIIFVSLHLQTYLYTSISISISITKKKYLLEQKSPFEASDRFLLNC